MPPPSSQPFHNFRSLFFSCTQAVYVFCKICFLHTMKLIAMLSSTISCQIGQSSFQAFSTWLFFILDSFVQNILDFTVINSADRFGQAILDDCPPAKAKMWYGTAQCTTNLLMHQ